MGRNYRRGVVAILASAFGFALMAACVRLTDDLGAPISCFEKSCFRNVVALGVALVVLVRSRRRGEGAAAHRPQSPREWALVALRCALGTLGIFTNYYALSHVPIAEGQLLNKTAPFFTVVFAALFLGERATLRQLFALVLALSGVVLVVRPGHSPAESFALGMGLVSGVAAGGAYAALRALRRHAVDGAFIVAVFSLFSCLAAVPPTIFAFTPMTLAQVAVMTLAGAGAAIGQFGITAAYALAPPRELAVFDYASVIFAALFGFALFGQVPDLFAVVGFVVIVGAAVLNSAARRD